MDSNRILASLNYFSIFFAPFLFPLIILLIVQDNFTKMHAKRALITHIIPVILSILFLIVFVTSAAFASSDISSNIGLLWIILLLAYLVVTLGFAIWNIVQGIKLLRTQS